MYRQINKRTHRLINAKIDALVITYVDTERYITTWTDGQIGRENDGQLLV